MAEKRVSVRLAAVGGRQVRAELEGVGEAGARGFGRLSREMEAANARLAAFSRRVQFQPGETVWDVTGAYGLGPIIPPQITGTASRTEAFAAMLAGADGGHDPALVRQVERGVQALLQHQFRPGPTHLMRRPEAMRGGITGAPGDLVVRNDYVQHAGSAYLRYLAALAERR